MIQLTQFTGEIPRVLPHLLPENAAQFAQDCDFSRGVLAGMPDRATVPGIGVSGLQSLFVYDSLTYSWYGWNRDVDAVRGPVANDAYSRFYWTDGTDMFVSRGDMGSGGEPQSNNKYKVGVPAPTQAMYRQGGDKFDLPAVASMSAELICESADGTVTKAQAVTLNTTSSTSLTQVMSLSANGFSCAATGAVANESDLVSIGFVTPSAPDPEHGLVVAPSYSVFPLFGTGAFGAFPLYFYALLPESGVPGTAINMFVNYATSPRLFYNLGGGWWCTQPGLPAPSSIPQTLVGMNNAINQVTATMAVRLTLHKTGGGASTALIRPLAANSTLSPELEGCSASFTTSGSTVTITLSRASSAVEHRAYIYTRVNNYGEESAPSPPFELDTVEGVSLPLVIPSESVTGYCPISMIRVYRTAGTAGQYLYVGELTFGTSLFTDAVRTEALGEPVSTIGHTPPEYGLKGLVSLPNGILAAFKNNEVHFSEPYQPSIWKASNIMTTGSRVVGLCPAEGGVFVTTTTHPYFIAGMTPDAMSQQKITNIQAGVSKGSICNIGPSVVYATNDGLATARGVDVSMDFSFKFFTREEWRKRYGGKLSQMRINAHDGHLLIWFSDGTPGFLLRYDEVEASFTRLTSPVTAAFVHPQGDSLYVANGSIVYSFKSSATRLPFIWHSKDYITPKPVNFGALSLFGDKSVKVTVLADGVIKHTQTVTLTEDFGVDMRLPSGFLARKWSVKIEGVAGASVSQLCLAGSFMEMQSA